MNETIQFFEAFIAEHRPELLSLKRSTSTGAVYENWNVQCLFEAFSAGRESVLIVSDSECDCCITVERTSSERGIRP